MAEPTLHETQTVSFFDCDFGYGLSDYSNQPKEQYDVVRHDLLCDPNANLELSALDMCMPRTWFPLTYAFENKDKKADFMSPEKLKASLAKALAIVPAFSGRLTCESGGSAFDFFMPKARTHVQLNNKGAWFATDTMKTPFSDMRTKYLGKALLPGQFFFNRLQKEILEAKHGNADVPLLAIKAIYFDCGSVIMTVYFHHLICDGTGIHKFMRVWGQLTRGVTPDPLTDSRHLVSKVPKLNAEEAAIVQCQFEREMPPQPNMSDMMLCDVSIPDSRLKELKNEINAKIAPQFVSSDDLYFTILARMLLRSRNNGEDPKYVRTANIRKKLGLNESDFGNFVGVLREGPVKLDIILNSPLEEAVLYNRKALLDFHAKKVIRTVREYVSVDVSAVPEQLNNIDGSRDLGATSLAGFLPEKLDFDNSPASYLFGCYYYNGAFTILPIFDGKFNGVACVDKDILDAFIFDPEAKKLGFTVTLMKKYLFK
ncbi:hypothetical protein DSO57_1004787 [Entomophthora muscae]|uniref:Uncharacterized protein n=1 Tax=Entomophthora muscae TaxID=34485 RepID=A0ACC2UU24_9FUNG|nr:hypothetical protein DSO57_1004787 [Entomophthora muscae]